MSEVLLSKRDLLYSTTPRALVRSSRANLTNEGTISPTDLPLQCLAVVCREASVGSTGPLPSGRGPPTSPGRSPSPRCCPFCQPLCSHASTCAAAPPRNGRGGSHFFASFFDRTRRGKTIQDAGASTTRVRYSGRDCKVTSPPCVLTVWCLPLVCSAGVSMVALRPALNGQGELSSTSRSGLAAPACRDGAL